MDTKSPASENQELRRLSESPLELADPRQEIRGCKVYDSNRDQIGEIKDLFIDEQERHVRFLLVASGGLSAPNLQMAY